MEELPTEPADRALALQEMLVAMATSGTGVDNEYRLLRRELVERPETARLLPQFVRVCRTLSAFWQWVKAQAPTYAERRIMIREAFVPLLDFLERTNAAPADVSISETLESFDEPGVHKAWTKALDRRFDDPEGAVTLARTLLETVCKSIQDAQGAPSYSDDDDLPKLYRRTAELLNLAPSQHTEEAFKSILGSCQNIVNNIGTIRNKIGDAHGQGRRAVRPSARHAALVVNLAGAMAMFLIETQTARQGDASAASA
ncbi:hypothetical protein ACVWWG_004054 [Bradyrhizobium sp. LB7.2]|uniref:abortive infection family protein n=1 Tax=Bradyrhizobium sp. LB14.3 TaxID=3156328 RepID=UPI00339AB496